MDLPIFQVDAFAQRPFTGNPAAVVPLKKWLTDEQMQQVAIENNLSETAFFVPKGNEFHIRWFTPASEVNLCGHATLASGYVLFHELGFVGTEVRFHSISGPLFVSRDGERLTLDFPSWNPVRLEGAPGGLQDALGGPEILGVYENRDLLVELENEKTVARLCPDFMRLREVGKMVIVTAPGDSCDFVSRFFAPGMGVDEDPVTGSAHSQLIPFWGEKLGKKQMFARQLSARGGELWCTWEGDRVGISGYCSFFLKGTITIP